MTRTLAGDRGALDSLIARHLPALRAFVRLRIQPFLRQREEADDIVQSVCRELLGQLDRFEYQGETRFRNWLYVAVLNKLRQKEKYYRAEKRAPQRAQGRVDDTQLLDAYSSIATPSERAMAREQIELLEAAFDQLPEHYREVITLSRMLGLSHAQIAAETGRTVSAVRNLLPRALVKLSAVMEELGA